MTTSSATATATAAAQMTLNRFFAAINDYDVERVLACMTEDVVVTYPDAGRNWTGRERGRVVLNGILGMMRRLNQDQEVVDERIMQVTYDVVQKSKGDIALMSGSSLSPTQIVLHTKEDWSHSGRVMKTKARYCFTSDGSLIQSMET